MNDFHMSNASDMMNFVMNINSFSGSEIPNTWKKVVSKIGKKNDADDDQFSIGERIAGNTKVIDLRNGVLLIEANHSGWIQYMKIYQKFILNGLKWALPDLNITSLAFRLEGSSAKLNDSYEQSFKQSQNEMKEKIEKQEKELEKINKKNPENDDKVSTLPPEILAKFENIKNELKCND